MVYILHTSLEMMNVQNALELNIQQILQVHISFNPPDFFNEILQLQVKI
jgi:hypothetical protein